MLDNNNLEKNFLQRLCIYRLSFCGLYKVVELSNKLIYRGKWQHEMFSKNVFSKNNKVLGRVFKSIS